MYNPILARFHADPINHPDAVVAFDSANSYAWKLAGRPDDSPGSNWAKWESEALRAIESHFTEKGSSWDAIDSMLSEWDDFDGDVSDFYQRWSDVLQVRPGASF